MKRHATRFNSQPYDTDARLFGLVLRHASGDRVPAEARALATQMGCHAARDQVSAAEMADALIGFRRALQEAVLGCDRPALTMDAEGLELARRIGDFADEFLLAELEAYSEEQSQA